MNGGDHEAGTVSLPMVQLFNWLVLLLLCAGGWLWGSLFVAASILVGGVVANLSFLFLKRDLTTLLRGPLDAAKARFFIRYYLRLALVTVVLFLLVRKGLVHTIGLLIGLSTVFLGIVAAVLGAVKDLRIEKDSTR
ncbi:MAG: ATP synthase subunit I [Thermodesulfobacteriota bacterium]